jgi:DNA-binding MarR family transcriptional regulator
MQVKILMYVNENKHMGTTDVADYFNIATATASIAIKKLVKK